MSWFRNLRVGTRLLVNAAVALALLIVVAAVGLTASSAQQNLATAAEHAGAVAAAAGQVKYRAADFNGWQTAYAFDVDRGVAGASSDDSASRKAFLSSTAAFSTEIGALQALHPSAAIATDVQTAQTEFNQYMTTDQQIIGLYRSGTPADRAAADKLVAGQEDALFTQIANAAAAAASTADRQAGTAFVTLNDKGRASRSTIVAICAVAVIVALAGALVLRASIVAPLRIMSAVLERIRTGDLTARAAITWRDEVGEMAAALDASTAATAAIVGQVTDNANQLAAASAELSTVSAQMSASAEQNSGQAGSVAAAAEQVSRNVQTVSAGAEEMGASIREIATSAGEASRVAADAARNAQRTNEIVGRLGESSAEIGNVVKMITSIAEQTNLLALNATIEAARAGDAGKGFAVVASEVKDLAQATAQATTDISDRINTVQDETRQAVTAIGQITEVITSINNYVSTIAAAVEEQTATTSEMARSVAEAATGSGEIANNITTVAQTADATASAATETQSTAQQLARTGAELQQSVAAYRT